MSGRKRVAILISGRGSNMQALYNASLNAEYPCEIVGVISNKADAAGLEFARENGLQTGIVSIKEAGSKQAADKKIDALLRQWQVDLVCLAGFMRLLTPEFCTVWQGRILNIHPSLLPDYPGLETHARALRDEVSEHGCTVHFVTAGMDEGPVIGQIAVAVLHGDTPERLAARVLQAEHKLYPWALAQVATGEVAFEDS